MNSQSSPSPLSPFLLAPALHVLVWGGQKFATLLGKPLPDAQPYGESWELHDTARIDGGPHDGLTIAELLAHYGPALIGHGSDPADGMPLLIKFLDANDWLSVQVHPDDADCRALEQLPRGKNEAWYVVQADPDGALINGVTEGVTHDRLADALSSGGLLPLLSQVKVRAGDALFMRAGTIHALGPGCLIYEVQQSCNVTYRLYDWDRLGLDGQPRALHIDKALRVSNPDLRGHIQQIPEGTAAPIFDNPFFTTTRHTLTDQTHPLTLDTGMRFQAISVLDGSFTVESAAGTLAIPRGRTGFVPACIDRFTLSGSGTALRSTPPEERPQ